MRRALVVVVPLVAACASTPRGPDPDAPPTAPFAPLLALPLTLQYVVDDTTGYACQLTDAGVPGADDDFKVSCTPDPNVASAWCMLDGYLGSTPSPAGAWQTTGCYAARRDGLWHFDTCPSDKAALDAPAAHGGVLALPANGKPPVDNADDGAQRRDSEVRVGTLSVPVECVTRTDAGMSKEIDTTECDSPLYGYVFATGTSIEMSTVGCQTEGHLVAVEPGLQAPKTCLIEPRAPGAYRFTTRVYQAADKTAVGVTADYFLKVELGDGCKLHATLEKRGIGKTAFAPKEVQRASGDLAVGCPIPDLGPGCFTFDAHLADESGKAFDARYYLPLTTKQGTGIWTYTKADLAKTGFAGALELAADDGPPLDFDAQRIDRTWQCHASIEHLQDDGGWGWDDSDAWQACVLDLHDSPE